jgi:hypothetical protein
MPSDFTRPENGVSTSPKSGRDDFALTSVLSAVDDDDCRCLFAVDS